MDIGWAAVSKSAPWNSHDKAFIRHNRSQSGLTSCFAGRASRLRRLADCPQCHEASIVLEEGFCAGCGYDVPAAQCAVCHKPLSIEEMENSTSLCGYHLYVFDKDD